MFKKIQIAIIDSGVNCTHPAFSNSNPTIIGDGKADETNSFYGHGTAIYNIFTFSKFKKAMKYVSNFPNFIVTNQQLKWGVKVCNNFTCINIDNAVHA